MDKKIKWINVSKSIHKCFKKKIQHFYVGFTVEMQG